MIAILDVKTALVWTGAWTFSQINKNVQAVISHCIRVEFGHILFFKVLCSV